MSEDSFHLGIKALIRSDSGEVLLLQVNPAKLHGERRNYWDLPGGRVQKGHSILENLKREVAEETGISDIKSTEELGMVLSNIRIPVGKSETVGLILGIYQCKIVGDSNVTISDEHVTYGWFAPKDAAKLLAVKYPKHFCELIATL
jgi:8-oxo-dGTP pyrophosphatase MutT (NUDIX family)